MEQKPHILIVDNDRAIRDLLSLFLARHHLGSTSVRGGREAQEALLNGCYHLVVLDVMLQDENGVDLARWIGNESDVPIVMLVALEEEADRVKALELGADDYVGKPFNPRELAPGPPGFAGKAVCDPAGGIGESIACLD
jgi:two-component system OmpR family response regulator